MKPDPSRRNPESGYILLFIFAMAAVVAIMLYMQLPRVAFEAQRTKEQLLINRGQQYTRAIQLYVRKFNRFPVDMAALENTQNIRFLRKQYVDPMTGKNEWRIIHVGPGGVFTDSLVHGTQKKDQSAPQTFITELQQVGGNGNTGTEGVNIATRRRPSDQAGAPGDPSNGNPANPASSGAVTVLPDGRIVPLSSTGIPIIPGASGATTPQPGLPVNAFGSQPPAGIGIQNGAPPPPPGTPNQPNAPPAAAANLINQILTTPRPGGLNGLNGTLTDPNQSFQPGSGNQPSNLFQQTPNTGTSAGQGLGGTQIGGGIAGVASKLEQEGIKVYGDRTAYNEWEFVYDMSQDRSRVAGQGQQQPQQQRPPQQTPAK